MIASPVLRLLVAASCLVACGPAHPESTAPALSHDAPRGVVLVLVDQLRADTAAAEMPRVTALAERGVTFERMRSTAPWTYPSVLSLFSGLYPQQHGANGTDRGNQLLTFDPEIELLHETLGEAGFATAGFVTNPFLNTWNSFHEGFDHYEIDAFINDLGNKRGKHGAGKPSAWTTDMFADTVNPEVIAHWSQRDVAEHEFTYVHFIDVHGPWDHAPFEHDYTSSVRWIDDKIAELHEFFSARYDGDLLFVLTSDHGQDLGDDESVGRGEQFRRRKKTMHDFNLRVPLMVLQGAPVPAGVRVPHAASAVDVLPTLLDWIGVSRAGQPITLPGFSWHPWIETVAAGRTPDTPTPDRPLYASMSAFKWHTDALIEGDVKVVRRVLLGGVRVPRRDGADAYDLAVDPRELQALSGGVGKQQLGALTRAASPSGIKFEARLQDTSGDTGEQLSALGYLGGDDDFVDPDDGANDSPKGGADSDG
ncbi:MAG: hypothetical protein DHS20C15_33000 [Planctomycetota bacterium]|nr:MAG: hypothetical protein DHS20C15_33000 [Planctomycetota bacterium]